MTRVPLLGVFLLGLASCGLGTSTTDQTIVCYDTGHGAKCVPMSSMPRDATALCSDQDGNARDSSESSADGPSPEDDDTSVSSDAANADGEASGESHECGAPTSDDDDDGVSNERDCDCVVLPPPDPGLDRVSLPGENVSRPGAGGLQL